MYALKFEPFNNSRNSSQNYPKHLRENKSRRVPNMRTQYKSDSDRHLDRSNKFTSREELVEEGEMQRDNKQFIGYYHKLSHDSLGKRPH